MQDGFNAIGGLGEQTLEKCGVLKPQSGLLRRARFSVRSGKPFLRPRLPPISHRGSGGQGWPPGHRASGAERGLEGREPDGMLKKKGLPPKNRRETATLASLAPLYGSKPRQNKDLSQQSSGTEGRASDPVAGTLGKQQGR